MIPQCRYILMKNFLHIKNIIIFLFMCILCLLNDVNQDGWATALQTLELTLEEVIHIRSVLTKAELENLPLDGNLKEDVEKGKVVDLNIQGYYHIYKTFTQFFIYLS